MPESESIESNTITSGRDTETINNIKPPTEEFSNDYIPRGSEPQIQEDPNINNPGADTDDPGFGNKGALDPNNGIS